VAFYNKYGPTEATITVTEHCFSAEEAISRPGGLPIGKPVSNTQIYILDQAGQPVPVGVSGELHIGGAQVARGYLNQPALTQQQFLPNPFSSIPGARMYKTGDLATWRPGGYVEYIRRIDEQVKVRGYRIELGEVEAVLQQLPGILQSAVIIKEATTGHHQLIAYIVSKNAISIEGIRQAMSLTLPEYMIPSLFVELEALPLTPNGKADRQQLRSISVAAQSTYTAPVTVEEWSLAAIWHQVLGIEQVGIHDNFFEAGGNSLKAIQAISRIKKSFRSSITVRDFFRYPTIAGLASLLKGLDTGKSLLIPLNHNRKATHTLFMIPPIVGTAAIFSTLAARLEKKHINCLGFQYKGFDEEEAFHQSIEAMAASFAQEIIQYHTGGKVSILGYSMGATVAMEVAYLLEKNNYAVSVILVDSYPADNRNVSSPVLLPAEAEEQAYLDGVLNRHAAYVDAAFSDTEGERIRALVFHNNRILRKYQLDKQLRSAILALEAREDGRTGSMQQWARFSTGPFRHEFIRGDHFSLLSSQYLGDLARSLTSFIKVQ
jgi:thioesterase domain-containing protein